MTTTEIEEYFGTVEKVAQFFEVSTEAIYQWRAREGKLIPKGRATEAAIRTNGELKFNPELYRKQ
ncbi:cell division protein [Pectobacterium carotovorum subsp. carotovorum]|uniref:Cro/CI family transcriptional regulator n=1 Tax=Pectobacterium carotovorum TaxID=554 RepID=UPI0013742F7B|nr:Cro/CI family transcriptional regulator [Pectobacterium carotovorum]QHP55042.1 cell division protein [Pectobacterium carotovorum subsp. carotovorum]